MFIAYAYYYRMEVEGGGSDVLLALSNMSIYIYFSAAPIMFWD